MGPPPQEQVVALQARVRGRLAQLRRLAVDDEGYPAAAQALIDSAMELIDYEEQLPILLDRRPRWVSLQIVRWSGVFAASVGASLGVAAIAGWSARWWLLLAILPGLAALTLLRAVVPG